MSVETTAKKGLSFVQEVMARIEGDNSEALAQRNRRKAMSTVEGQMAALKAKIVDQEADVEDAQEAVENSYYPTEKITDGAAYLRGIVEAEEVLAAAVETLEETNDLLAKWTKVLKKRF